MKLRAKYYLPTSVGLDLYVPAKTIGDKIYKLEVLYTQVNDPYVRDEILRTIYSDFRTFIFSPLIYSTTTQEMKPEFKKAYCRFISSRRKSQLRPLVMSYLDKQKSYTEENFKNDYPYEFFENDNSEFSAYVLSDVFVNLRKNIFDDSIDAFRDFKYVYSISSASWHKYTDDTLSQGEFAISEISQNNYVLVYDNKFSIVQELNIPRFSKFYFINGALILFNSDRLQLSKVVYNGRNFVIQAMSSSDITSFFPGIDIIYIDSYQSYTIDIQKENEKSFYIVLSRYMQGFNNYEFSVAQGNITKTILPTVFGVDSTDDVVLLFKDKTIEGQETSDNSPTYKIEITTDGYGAASYDKTYGSQDMTDIERRSQKDDDIDYSHNPNIMPKIIKEGKDDLNAASSTNAKYDGSSIPKAPLQELEPPED